jgi:hypothetical protein
MAGQIGLEQKLRNGFRLLGVQARAQEEPFGERP